MWATNVSTLHATAVILSDQCFLPLKSYVSKRLN